MYEGVGDVPSEVDHLVVLVTGWFIDCSELPKKSEMADCKARTTKNTTIEALPNIESIEEHI